MRRGAMSSFPEEASMQPVSVQWIDSWGGDDKWETRPDNSTDTFLDLLPIGTIGYLAGIDAVWVAIAQSVAESQIGHVLRIPKACILDFEVLNVTTYVPTL